MKTININNKQFQEFNVVMLPTESNSGLLLGKSKTGKLVQYNTEFTFPKNDIYNENQHLYILSNEEIKEDNWCIDITTNRIFQFKNEKHYQNCDFKKIIATTDSSLNPTGDKGIIAHAFKEEIPQIPQSFIEDFIQSYNQGNVISKVLVEVEFIVTNEDWSKRPVIVDGYYQIKLNQNNEISILTEVNTCKHLKEVGCIKDICTCNKGPKHETLEEATKN
jgi:hypothetical protein